MRSSVEATLAWLTVRQTLANRRALWALLLALLPVGLAFLARAYGGPAEGALARFVVLFTALIVPVLLPLIALVVGTGAFGNEIDDGTITYLLGKPIPRWRIVLTRIVVCGALTAAVVAPATLLAGLVANGGLDGEGVILAFTGAVILGSFLYCALFVAISLSTKRALVAGLAYVVVWEGALSANMGGTRALSVRQYTLSFAEGLSTAPAEVFSAALPIATAGVMAAVVALLAAAHAIRRLRGFEIGEAA